MPLHSARILLEAATIEGRPGATGAHPFQALVPAAETALTAVTAKVVGRRA